MSIKKIPRLVPKTPGIVARIPGSVAYNDLLERIVDHGVVLDGGSRLTAMGHVDKTHLSAKANRNDLQLVAEAGMHGAAQRRRGAPMFKRTG